VVGSIQGHLRTALGKLAKIHKKQEFSFCIVTGDFFGDGSAAAQSEELEELFTGSLEVPLPTYFTVGDFALPQRVLQRLEKADANDEVCTNLFYLSRKGTFKTSDGINIVSVGGKLVSNDSSMTTTLGKYDPLYLEKEATALIGAHSADILITNQWPASITSGSSNPVPEILRTDQGVQCLAELCSKLKPRYHFSSSPDASWEREAFKNPVEYGSLDLEPVTYFRSLGSVTRPIKEWFSAFKLDRDNLAPAPTGTTPTPFGRGRKRSADNDHSNGFSRYENGNHARSDGNRNKKSKRHHVNGGRDECFMCFNNMEINNTEHLVSSIGETSGLTVPRGPLPLPGTFPQLTWSGHVLIIPYHHAGAETIEGPRPQVEIDAEFEEMAKFRKALCKMVNTVSRGTLGSVCWDTNRTGIRHMHWQWMAVPVKLIKEGLLEAAFKVIAQDKKYPPFEATDPNTQLPVKSDYFRLWIYTPPEQGSNPLEAADRLSGDGDADEGTEKSIYFPLPSDQRFNIWLGREAMAKVLKLGERLNWDHVKQPVEEEKADRDALMQQFTPWDFTLPEAEAPGNDGIN
jgi:hypothetical protein